MKEELLGNIKIFAKISGKASLAWIKVTLIGAVIMIVDLVIAIILLGDNTGGGFPASAHAGILGAVMGFILLL